MSGGSPRLGRGLRSVALLSVGVGLGCVPTSPRARDDVHAALMARTGSGVGEASRTAPGIPQGVQLDDGLTEDEAVSLALWNNPELQATLADLGFARADLYEAGRLPNPLFSTFLPLGPKQLEMTVFQSIAALWQRPSRVRAAKRDVERVAESLVAAGLDTVRSARVAFAELILAHARLTLLRQAAETWRRMAKLAQARLDAGAASLLEVTAVATDARAAELAVERQLAEVLRREAELRALLAVPEGTALGLRAEALRAPSLPGAVDAVDALVERALAARPEVRAAELGIEAAGARAGLATAEIFDLILVVDANSQGREGFEVGPGGQVVIPLFYQNQGGRARASAELERATWRYLAARVRIEREVSVARAALERTQLALEAWPDQVVAPLARNVERAEKAYAAGGVTYLQVLEATRRLIEARLEGLTLERQTRVAWADLRRSVGGLLLE